MSTADSGHYGVSDGASYKAALDRRGEAVDLFSDDGTGHIGCPGGAALRDERQLDLQMATRPALRAGAGGGGGRDDAPCFLPVEIVGQAHEEGAPLAGDADTIAGVIEIDIAGGHRLRISGAYDPEALARLIRGLSG